MEAGQETIFMRVAVSDLKRRGCEIKALICRYYQPNFLFWVAVQFPQHLIVAIYRLNR
jgi:hypothetical protein